MPAQVLVRQDADPAVALAMADRGPLQPGPGEVVVAVSASAVCRTDLQLVSGELNARRLPIVPGHQVVGTVSAIGAGVTHRHVGQRVGLVWLARSCGTCRFCTSGRENLCMDAQFTGWDVDGGYADEVVARADFSHPLPDLGPSFPAGRDGDIAVAPLLCGGAIGFRSLRVAGIGPHSARARLGLFGFGASALLATQVAHHWGVRTFVVTRSADEARRARQMGAEWAGTYDDPVPAALDAAITFAPVGWVVPAALRSLDRGGTVAINAIHLDDIPPLDYDDLWWERSIRSVANVTRADVDDFLSVVGPAGVQTQTEALPLRSAPQALARLRAGDVAGAFVLVPR